MYSLSPIWRIFWDTSCGTGGKYVYNWFSKAVLYRSSAENAIRILKKPVKCAIYTNTQEKHGQKIQNKTDLEKSGFTKQNNSKRYRTLCLYIEETQSMYKPNVQNSLSEIVNYRQSEYFFEKNCKKVLQNAQRCYILKLRKRLSYKTGRMKWRRHETGERYGIIERHFQDLWSLRCNCQQGTERVSAFWKSSR